MTMNSFTAHPIAARFTETTLAGIPLNRDSAIVPTVRATPFLKYGKHAYYCYNFTTGKRLCVEIGHWPIIAAGLATFQKALAGKHSFLSWLRQIPAKYHYGFSFAEQIMLMTVPHTAVPLGNSRFVINLWSYPGFLDMDCRTKNVKYIRLTNEEEVLGASQCHHRESGKMYCMTYSLRDSFARIKEPARRVSCSILKYDPAVNTTTTIWDGLFADYLHDIQVNQSNRFCVVCELGMYPDNQGGILPSRILVVDMPNGRHWILPNFTAAAHAQFDPEDDNIIYFSNHNFKFIHTPLRTLLRNATYAVKFNGPASVCRYILTPDGPRENGRYTAPDLFRLTNFHVFMHRGRKILAAMSFPNVIHIVDAGSMTLLTKIRIYEQDPGTADNRHDICRVGSMAPSLDGENLYVQTTRSFQVISVKHGTAIFRQPLNSHHTCANHIQVS